uniref:DSL domain-containing protein n=1 Tax=Clytia hemisphaerica TaxID=252671 RepID=A0A7M5UR99_9CNID
MRGFIGFVIVQFLLGLCWSTSKKMAHIEFKEYDGIGEDSDTRCQISFEFEVSLTSDISKVLGKSTISPFDCDAAKTKYDINSVIKFDFDKFGVSYDIKAEIKRHTGRRYDVVTLLDSLSKTFSIGRSQATGKRIGGDIDKTASGKARTIEWEFRVYCNDSDYLLPDCTIERCVPRDDTNGHYMCDAQNNKVCLQGWVDATTNCVTQNVTKPSISSSIAVPQSTLISSLIVEAASIEPSFSVLATSSMLPSFTPLSQIDETSLLATSYNTISSDVFSTSISFIGSSTSSLMVLETSMSSAVETSMASSPIDLETSSSLIFESSSVSLPITSSPILPTTQQFSSSINMESTSPTPSSTTLFLESSFSSSMNSKAMSTIIQSISMTSISSSFMESSNTSSNKTSASTTNNLSIISSNVTEEKPTISSTMFLPLKPESIQPSNAATLPASSTIVIVLPGKPVQVTRADDKWKWILIIVGSSAIFLIFLLCCCFCCQRRRLRRKLEQHEAQIEELREMSRNNNSSLRGRTYSNVSLDKEEAIQRHEKNKDLLAQDGSEFIGFTNEMFQPDTSRTEVRRPSLGPSRLQPPQKRSNRIPSLSDAALFPHPPFDFMNPLHEDEHKGKPRSSSPANAVQKNGNPQNAGPPSPPPPPPPPPPAQPQTPVKIRSSTLNSLDRFQQQQNTSPMDSLLGEFKKKISVTEAPNNDQIRPVRASTFSKNANKDIPSKPRRTTTDVNKLPTAKKPNRMPAKKAMNGNVNGDINENEFEGFYNRTFNPEMNESASRF